ncbi:hypothetical protein EGI22_13950 [Lacihabitans sp. LS3-19]|uniref:hypothetical protein n=1 Tax=Lacihabitans sp. LS3-19 TaxID=2487335 RepID=UPI0020CC0CB1|nr:hypothetical protein [Lacihabitans sp. LS3-19]MCP9769018.1 hypothetical protein [Lacihabitans sp. LS3-19]
MNEHLENLKEIRSLMERSSKFLSLSGLSGISAGIIALVGAYFVYAKKVEITNNSNPKGIFDAALQGTDFKMFVFQVACFTLIGALISGIYFTVRKAKKSNEKIWNNLSKKLLLNLSIPLVTGALFSLALVQQNMLWMAASSTLIFYGLALIFASNYTVRDVFYLGLLEIVLGLLSVIFVGYTFLFWVVGFGVLHILYGSSMYFKYDK